MKHLILIVGVISLAACSTAKKADTNKVTDAEKTAAMKTAKDAKKAKPEVKTASDGQYTCQVLNDKRIVEYRKENGRCEIHYTKFGSSEQVAWAEATPSLCAEVFGKIRTNIEGRGFECTSTPKGLASK